MSNLSPSITSMLPSDNIINCLTTVESGLCKWYSPSSTDRSNPNNNSICPSNKKLCWRDTTENNKREFKCGICDIGIHSQTNDCHISLTANNNQDTTNWETTMTTNYNKLCVNKWRQF